MPLWRGSCWLHSCVGARCGGVELLCNSKNETCWVVAPGLLLQPLAQAVVQCRRRVGRGVGNQDFSPSVFNVEVGFSARQQSASLSVLEAFEDLWLEYHVHETGSVRNSAVQNCVVMSTSGKQLIIVLISAVQYCVD